MLVPKRLAAPAPRGSARSMSSSRVRRRRAGRALAVRPVRSAADRDQGGARRRLDGVGQGGSPRARSHRLAGEPRPRHARRRCRAVRRGGRPRARHGGADGDPLLDAARCGLRSAGHDGASRRSAGRVGTATTASSTPAATAAAPRCSGRSTNRRSLPASRCSSGRSHSTSIVGTSIDGGRQAAGIRVAMLDADGAVTSVGVVTGSRGGDGDGRLRAGVRVHVEPAGRDR